MYKMELLVEQEDKCVSLSLHQRSDKPSAQQLTALAEYLLGRADDEATQHTVPIKVFLSMAHNMGVNIIYDTQRQKYYF